HEGRRPGLKLRHKSAPITLKNWGNSLAQKISACGGLLSLKHQQSVSKITKAFTTPERTPAAMVLEQMQAAELGFFDYTKSLAKQHQQRFLAEKINQKHFAYLDNQAKISCQAQREIEDSDKVSFDVFLANYFKR
ncbi:MAG: glutamate--cysteine ligase, partial [Betaproteobacteria bacterium]|nr:glutamate--cysteine ligase [Betaproteobacteria bacterium]